MEGFDAKAYREAFLQANANQPFIASQLADVVRYLMRAVSSNDASGGLSSAAEKMNFVCDLISRSPESLSWYSLFSDAVAEIQEAIPDDPDDRKFITAAKRGTKYLVERSALDGAARGRASKRLDEFRQAINWSLDARDGRA